MNIETIPSETCEIPEIEVKLGNIRDPEKIKERREEALAKAKARLALSAFTGRVLCITLRSAAGKMITNFANTPDDEPKIIEWAWGKIANDREGCQLVTFNGSGFDVPFLRIRSIQLGVKFPDIEIGKYKCGNPESMHFDVMRFLHDCTENDPFNESMGLGYFTKHMLGVPFPYADIDQSQLDKLYLSPGGPDKVKALCEWNTTHTLMLAHKIANLYKTSDGPAPT